ncbi:hypothetical protein BSKO_08325 [Bryopsis sp. KO-2023]|nr:hypothetical protein BSKO_08325 [Bryopsis sp. KO-2023]
MDSTADYPAAPRTAGQPHQRPPVDYDKKIKDFVRVEIINKFLRTRPDYPRNDPAMLGALWEVASQDLAKVLPPLAHVSDACELYETVDLVADHLAAKFCRRPDRRTANVQVKAEETLLLTGPKTPSSQQRQQCLWDPLPLATLRSNHHRQTHQQQQRHHSDANVEAVAGNKKLRNSHWCDDNSRRQRANNAIECSDGVEDDDSCSSSDKFTKKETHS